MGDGGPATSAPLIGPGGVAVDAGGNLFIADAGNQRVRKVDLARPAITSPPPGAVLLGTSFTMTLASSVPPGAYQVRVIGLSATGQPVGVFSDALTVMVQ